MIFRQLVRRPLCLAVSVLALCLIAALPVRAAQPVIDQVILTNSTSDLLVYFNVSNAFDDDQLAKVIMAGVPTTFTFSFEVEKVNRFWPDKEIKAFELSRTIKYDAVTGLFSVTFHRERGKSKTTTSWRAAQELMADFAAVKVIPLKRLERDSTYRLRIRAQLLKPELPWALNVFFFWVPLGDVETEWFEVEFRR